MVEYSEQLVVQCNENFREILMAELAAINYDSFQETDAGFIAHSTLDSNEDEVRSVINRYKKQANAFYQIEKIQTQNWNKKWEESYEPILVTDKVVVRASFHKENPEVPIEIIINPKMSFGTGHHETTYLMMKSQLEVDHNNKVVLDAGCGTGILSILAGKLGAISISAFDNDHWVKDNIEENFKTNGTKANIEIGTISELSFSTNFDIILANINKNVLLHDIPFYSTLLNTHGHLLLSGFYAQDLTDIQAKCEEHALQLDKTDIKSDWMTARFLKK